jgi:arginine/lysine/ornithine decarboxylase
VDILVKIKRLVIARQVVFSAKAREERLACELTVEEIIESILNAPTINKTLRSTSRFRKSQKEKLYVIISSTYDGKVIYTKGTIRKLNQREEFYILISSKWSSHE